MSTLVDAVAAPQRIASESNLPESAPAPTVPAVLAGYMRTLLVPLVGLATLVIGWTLTSPTGWPAAVATVAVYAGAVAIWLYRQAWSPALVHLVTWASPVALLAPSTALGWLSADGLVLWAPVTTVLAACLALTHQPLLVTRRRARRA